jgi:hypothetical protein
MKEAVLRGGLFYWGRATLRVAGRGRGENELNQSLMAGFSDVYGARPKKKFEVEGDWPHHHAYLSR